MIERLHGDDMGDRAEWARSRVALESVQLEFRQSNSPKETTMPKTYALLAMLSATLLLAACADEEEVAEREAEQMAERTEAAIAEDPATERPVTDIPAPENVSEPPADATRTENGLAYVALQDAPGDVHPAANDMVTVHYTGWTTDGRMFDSSVARGEPATLPLNQLIAGWQQGLPLMTVGDKFRFWIPGELAYANSSRPGAPKGMLVFDIELLGVTQSEEAAQESPQAAGGE